MAKYLVTGGAGFIGSNIVEELVNNGEYVRVIDDLSTGFEDNLAPFTRDIDFIKGDIRSEKDMEKALSGIDFVIHQAAIRSVPKSVDDPATSNDVNVSGTLNVLRKAKEAEVKRLVYASSSSVYGDSDVYPQKESLMPEPISPYAVSKLSAEYYCRMFSHTLGLETVSLRYFNVFGPRQNPESKYSAVIPAFISALLNDSPCRIHGDGKQSRDFTYVSNVVSANLAACRAQGVSGGYFNVACGDDHSVVELAGTLKDITGKDIESVHEGRRPGDVMKTFADITALREKLGVEPGIGFREGLERTVEWFVEKDRKAGGAR
jgi:nucleoside-diphosphate-sugar epimerase